jgi:hypothetical protein
MRWQTARHPGFALALAIVSVSLECAACHAAEQVGLVGLPAPECPLPVMKGTCAPMTREQKASVVAALEAHVVAGAQCGRVRDALLEWLGGFRQSWVFESHAGDNPLAGLFVLGITASYTDTPRPAALALRRALFIGHPSQLARAAFHEAAHLVGADEEGASGLEALCISGLQPGTLETGLTFLH